MKNIFVVSFIIVYGCLPIIAQQPKLNGKVISTEKPLPRLWGGVRIKVKNRINNQEVEGEQTVTSDQDWYHGAPLGASVDVLFDKDCYVSEVINVNVRPGENPQQTVQLQRKRECLINDRRQQRTRDKRKAGARANLDVSALGVVIHGSVAASVSSAVDYGRDKTAGDRDLFPSGGTLQQELENEAKFARESGFRDTFQYNFGVKQKAYADDVGLMEILSNFKNNAQNADLFKEVGEIKPEMYDDVIGAQFEIPGEVNLDNIKKVLRDEDIGPSLRGSATVGLLNLRLDDSTRNELTQYFQSQTENSPIFRTSLVARARLDDRSLYQDLQTNSDQARVILMIEAIAVARIADDRDTFSEASQALTDVASRNKDPLIRQSAFSALRAFAYRSDQTAINALLTGVRKDPNPAVRFWVAVSLGVGDLEDNGSVRKVLRLVATRDSSSDVRRAANSSLSGAQWIASRY